MFASIHKKTGIKSKGAAYNRVRSVAFHSATENMPAETDTDKASAAVLIVTPVIRPPPLLFAVTCVVADPNVALGTGASTLLIASAVLESVAKPTLGGL